MTSNAAALGKLLGWSLRNLLGPQLRWNWTNRGGRPFLELCRFHGDGDADEEDTGERDGRVAAPIARVAVPPSCHAPHIGRVARVMPFGVVPPRMMITAHFNACLQTHRRNLAPCDHSRRVETTIMLANLKQGEAGYD
eukprot:c12828_g1_i1 orf=348-761(+)